MPSRFSTLKLIDKVLFILALFTIIDSFVCMSAGFYLIAISHNDNSNLPFFLVLIGFGFAGMSFGVSQMQDIISELTIKEMKQQMDRIEEKIDKKVN